MSVINVVEMLFSHSCLCFCPGWRSCSACSRKEGGGSVSYTHLYTKGFLEGAAGTLTDAEKEYMHWGAKQMTLECGIRLLTDYLEGDTYFKICLLYTSRCV